MLTVEERHEIIARFENVAAMVKIPAGIGLDKSLILAVDRENRLREFYQSLNACTDWGVPS